MGAVWIGTVQKQELRRYSERFKARMVGRMTGPGKVSAGALSREVGIPQPTLSLWLKAAGTLSAVNDTHDGRRRAGAKRPEDWAPQEKLAAVLEAAAVPEADIGGWLRRKGLTAEHQRQWREQLDAGASAVFAPREGRGSREDRRRVKELERELMRKDKALAETAALLVLQGKMQALWGVEGDPTRQTSDEPSSRASRRRRPGGRS